MKTCEFDCDSPLVIHRFYLCFQTHHKEPCSVKKREINTVGKKHKKVMGIWSELKLNLPLRRAYRSLGEGIDFLEEKLTCRYLCNKYVPGDKKENKLKN